jgi:Leucine-rich repeat (LRR) protein
MAELASGAVSSLLGVIGNEARLLRGVRGDVQFIKEEMESMNSFLVHLARTSHTGGEHGVQVRTWMNQVRILANDCNNCIDKYVYRGNPDVHLRRSGLLRYLLWPPWFVRKMFAQHDAAGQLRVLKDRAREVGERRMRYDVKVLSPLLPPPAEEGALTTEAAYAAGDEDDDQPDADGSALASHRRAVLFKHRALDDYFQGKLVEWTEQVMERGDVMHSAAVVAPEADQEVIALARRALAQGHRSVLVDIPQVHMDFEPLRPQEILYYILCQLQQDRASSPPQLGSLEGSPDTLVKQYLLYRSKREISHGKESLLGETEIQQDIQNVMGKLDEVKRGIQDEQLLLQLLEGIRDVKELEEKPISVLFELLVLQQQAARRDQARGKAMRKLAAWHAHILRITAESLKKYIEAEHLPQQEAEKKTAKKFDFYDARYGYVIHKVFATKASNSKRRHGHVKIQGMISKVPQDVATETEEKIDEIKKTVQEQMETGWIVRKIIENHFEDDKRPLVVILRIGDKIYESNWDENRYAFTRLEKHVAGVLTVTTTRSTQQAKESLRQQELIDSFRQGEPLDYSLAGLYHDIVLQFTSHLMSEDKNEEYSDPQIIRDILGECEQFEFCMKILAHSFYARPKRSNQELTKLRDSLQAVSPKSFEGVAAKMLKFSYNDLPKEYKSCLLYLAIFPPGRSIRRSTLVARWVVEGLINRDDWNAAVRQSDRCFEALIDRGLVDPAEISGTGKAKSCIVGNRVHGFITMIAKKQHIVETRLSQHLAQHFSIFSDVRLRASEKIRDFLQVLPKQYHFSRLKVLDLEGCKCVGTKNTSYLKDVCCNLLLLKYLNLRSTNVTQLPGEINRLHELEVLDIRHNNVHKTATRYLRLLKLKRLLAGCIDDPTLPSVELPEKIGKMEGMEVLLGVMPRHKKDLKRGFPVCLRKLGVVINKDSYLQPLLKAIDDLHENLRSLSITLPIVRGEATPPKGNSQPLAHSLERTLDQLESLSISGITQMGWQLLPLLTEKSNQLTKVTLRSTMLKQDGLEVLAHLPKLHYLKLRHEAYKDTELTFKEDEFRYLKCFLVEGSNMTHIIFAHGATPMLEKMLLPVTASLKLSGVENLEKLEELELRNSTTITTTITIDNKNTLGSLLEQGTRITKVTLRGKMLKQDELQILGKKPSIRCLVLLDTFTDQTELAFKENEFLNLDLLIVECSKKAKISFAAGSCPKLEKLVTNIESLSGIGNLVRLKELELKVEGDSVPAEVKVAVNRLKDRLHFTHYKSENQDKEEGNQDDDVGKSPSSFWKNKGWCPCGLRCACV